MAWMPRRLSLTGYYHLIMRGNNKQVLYEAPEDYRFFISRLGRYSRELGVLICAYCLMENHAHILVYDPQGAFPEMMRKLGISYTKYCNERYERVGHMFQGAFLSEPVNDELYLTRVFRYILNNPQKAGICPASQYRWSTYKGFFRDSTALYLDFFREKFPTPEAYREYIGSPNDDECLEYAGPVRDDDWALGVIRDRLGVKSGIDLQTWDKPKRNEALRILQESGLSLRQMERLTGIGRKVITNALPH